MKRKSQTESGAQYFSGTTKSSRFEMKWIDKIAGRRSWLAGWQQLLHRFYAQSYLEALVHDLSYTHTVPELAYVCVEDVTFRGDTGK